MNDHPETSTEDDMLLMLTTTTMIAIIMMMIGTSGSRNLFGRATSCGRYRLSAKGWGGNLLCFSVYHVTFFVGGGVKVYRQTGWGDLPLDSPLMIGQRRTLWTVMMISCIGASFRRALFELLGLGLGLNPHLILPTPTSGQNSTPGGSSFNPPPRFC